MPLPRPPTFLLALLGALACSHRAPPPVHTAPPPAVMPALAAAGAAKLPPCPPAPAAFGTGIAGTLTTPSRAFPLAAVPISVLAPTGAPVASTLTDGCGRYQLIGLAPGAYQVQFGVRSFGGMAPLSLVASSTTAPFGLPIQLPVPFPGVGLPTVFDPVLNAAGLTAAVVQGTWDPVERLLDKMGVPYVLYQAEDLEQDAPYRHRMLFVACGAGSAPDKVGKKIKDYVTGGGALYASDLAIPYVGEIFDGAVTYDYESRGMSGTRRAYVVDPGLKLALKGADQIDITYDLGGWQRVAVDQPAGTLPLLRDVETNEPAAVSFQRGAGVVKYTTFHVETQVSEAEETALVYMITRM